MDQGLGLKNTHPVDDLASSSDVRIAKDNSGPVYESEETEEAFILTARHLKEKSMLILTIANHRSGEASSREKKKNVFRIPDGVDLNRIKAKSDELESTLRIHMPKVKTVVGLRIVEVKGGVDKKDGEEVKVGGNPDPEKKPAATEKSNPLRTPLIIVGSALLVSIVVLAINRIRNRKR